MIKIDHLSKKYNDNVVLDDISLEIKQGDVVGIIGPSGTGKSTLLRCVNRLEKPEKGTVTIGVQTTEMIFNKYVPGSFQAFLYIEPLRNSRQIE